MRKPRPEMLIHNVLTFLILQCPRDFSNHYFVYNTVERHEQAGIRVHIQKMGQVEFEVLIAVNQNLITFFLLIFNGETLF